MDIDLSGRTALVTGSTQGIGLAIAGGLAAAGAGVVVNGRTASRVDAAVARLQEERPGADVRGIAADVADADGAAELVERLPHVDVLVNNLGIFGSRPVLEVDDDEWRRYFEVNVLSGVRLTRAYLPGMIERGWGRVQFICSDSSVVIPAEMVHYGVTKTALLAVSRGFAKAASGTCGWTAATSTRSCRSTATGPRRRPGSGTVALGAGPVHPSLADAALERRQPPAHRVRVAGGLGCRGACRARAAREQPAAGHPLGQARSRDAALGVRRGRAGRLPEAVRRAGEGRRVRTGRGARADRHGDRLRGRGAGTGGGGDVEPPRRDLREDRRDVAVVEGAVREGAVRERVARTRLIGVGQRRRGHERLEQRGPVQLRGRIGNRRR
ncbi:hypothetical protein CFP66_43240 [Pseudonocardia sp. MH-G8]|nr:hypothetical protein CFP66_43240 [Pseudonocardia sp. MH-G8]